MSLKMFSANWQPFCLGLNMLVRTGTIFTTPLCAANKIHVTTHLGALHGRAKHGSYSLLMVLPHAITIGVKIHFTKVLRFMIEIFLQIPFGLI